LQNNISIDKTYKKWYHDFIKMNSMNNEVATLMNNEKSMKKIAFGDFQPQLFIIHY